MDCNPGFLGEYGLYYLSMTTIICYTFPKNFSNTFDRSYIHKPPFMRQNINKSTEEHKRITVLFRDFLELKL